MSKLKPTANIAVNKNVVPSGTNVYLKSGQEFEIELFNPTQDNILAKIYINDELISGTGLIIKPGRREWLERYINKPRKFKFDVYEIEANNSSVDVAIKNNGVVKVEFYKEKTRDNRNLIISGNWVNPLVPYHQPYVNPYFYDTYISTCNYVHNTDIKISDPDVLTTSNFSTDVTVSIAPAACSSKLKETGRIELGDNSNQSFTSVDMDFENWIITSYEYKLLPLSKKPVIVSEINNYCTSCGAKQKKTNHKFCPLCGIKYE